MTNIKDLISYIDEYLKINDYQDYGPNGLQVAGCEEINKIVTGVSICRELITRAIDLNADALLVHHGLLWQADNPCIIGPKKIRLQPLLQHDINLIAYHLPLDFHPEIGNNLQLAKIFGLKIATDSAPFFTGKFKEPILSNNFARQINEQLQRQPFYIAGKSEQISTIAWCSGGGADNLEAAARQGVDAYLTGEIAERTYHAARELGIHVFAVGHHATERYGIKALGEHLAKKFALEHQFMDIDNPL